MVTWPLGPLYFELPGAGGMDARSWVNYKLTAARWYTSTLKRLIDQAGFERYVGVEMALDGALASLNGSFDAAVAGLVGAAERYLQKDNEELVLTRPHKITDKLFTEAMRKLQQQHLDYDVVAIVAATASALEVGSDPDAPKGWLLQLKRLRNIPMHQDTAPRHIDVNVGSDAVTTISVAGHGQDPVEYLEDVTEKISALTSQILDLIDYLMPNGIPSLRPLWKADKP